MVVPVSKAKPMSLQILESPDTVEPLVDFLRTSTFKLACCSKKMLELYGKEAKSWRKYPAFLKENEDQTVESTLNRALMDYEMPVLITGRNRWNKPFFYPGLEAGLFVYASQAIRTNGEKQFFLGFKHNAERKWSTIEMEVRKVCKHLSCMGCKNFRICLIGFIERNNPSTGEFERVLITEVIPLLEANA